MKFTLSVTQECNLDCSYCYIVKKPSKLSLSLASNIIDQIFTYAPPDEKIDIGFFGGEPLIEFDLIKEIIDRIETHARYESGRVEISMVTNGTIFSKEIAGYLSEHNVVLCISCDGPPNIHDKFRKRRNGSGSSAVVEKSIKSALDSLDTILVNAVYRPETLHSLPDTIDYFSSLGVRHIHLNPDFSAGWTERDALALGGIYGLIGDMYLSFYDRDDPHFINLIDSKMLLLMKGGYDDADKCRMGDGELAFAPSGNIYPCERLIGNDDGTSHCIGNVKSRLSDVCSCRGGKCSNPECQECSLKNFCMNWCGCSNFFSTGKYDRVGPFICASEKAAVKAASDAMSSMKENGPEYVQKMFSFQSSKTCRRH